MASGSPTLLKLLEKAKTLPTKPGCYLMKNSRGDVLYVGKAKNLRPRVSSYFQNSDKSPKTQILVGHIREFDFVLTQSESEALILENNLIKKYTPKYNILMRDDKSYPYVVVDYNEPYPRLLFQRRVKRKKGLKVYGPFVHGSGIFETLRIMTKSFQLRDCSLREFQSRKEPCLLYQIKQCSAPCVDYISEKEYEKNLNLALNFFEKRAEESLSILEERMLSYAEDEQFEHAAMLRDNIDVLKNFLNYSNQENAELPSDIRNIDILAYHVGDIEVEISLYMVRNGLLLGHKNFHFPVVDCSEDYESEVVNFIFQYYQSTFESLPDLLVVDFSSDNRSLLKEALQNTIKLKVISPKSRSGNFSSLMKLTREHAKESQRVRIVNEDSVYTGLSKLGDLLALKERPVVLECYDIAIFQGSSPTAAQVVFRNGAPDKKSYRHYHLKSLPEGNNDFAMMKEVLERRIDNGDLPDVFIADGGKGQLSIFKTVLEEAGLDIPVCSIAKSKVKGSFRDQDIKKTQERLFIPGRANPYFLSKNKSLFKIITLMRDEAHRFSRVLHHKSEKKRTFGSWLDLVEGVGPVMKKNLLKKLTKSKAEVALMSADQLVDELGINNKLAKNILKVASDS